MRTALGYALLAAMAVVALRRPHVALLGLVACDYVRPQDANVTYGFERVRFSLAFTVLALGALVFAPARHSPRPSPFHAAVAVLFLAVLNSAAWAFEPDLALPRVSDWFKTLLQYLLICAFVRNLASLRHLFWTLGLSMGVIALRFLHGKFVLAEWGWEGPTDDRNELAMMLVMALPFLAVLALTARRVTGRVLALATLGPCALVVVLTLSRGGFLGGAAVAMYLLVRLRHRRWLVALAALGVVASLSFVPPEFHARIAGVQHADREDASARGRINAWHAAWAMLQDRPFTGVGVGNFLVRFERYAPDPRDPHVAHSSLFQIMGDAGLPGTLAWLFLVLRLPLVANALERRERKAHGARWTDLRYYLVAVRASWLGYLVCGAFLSMEDFDFFYHLLGITAALRAIALDAAPRANAP